MRYLKRLSGTLKVYFTSNRYKNNRNSNLKVGLFWGTTGTGKTYTAMDILDNPYTVFDIKTPWFDGYAGQENVIMDECGLGMMNYNYLKRLLDGYRMDVPIKGGSVQWTPTTIVLTSNIPLEDWYINIPKEDLWALERRIRKFQFPQDKELATAWLKGTLIEPAKRAREVDEAEEVVASIDPWIHPMTQDEFALFHGQP